jgi:FkbM family methyltransferase
MIKQVIKQAFNRLGVDIIPLNRQPTHTVLGLRSLPIRTVIDVGANKGQFARYIRPVFPQAQLYCFEPLPGPYQELKSYAEQQGRGLITTFNMALGEREGEVEMFLHTEHSPSSSLLATTELTTQLYPQTKRQEKVNVKLTTLDKVCQQLSAPLVKEILVKMDVQGYEDRVIQGGKDLLQEAKACLLEVSLNSLYATQPNFKELLMVLDGLGLDYAGNLSQVYAENGEVIYFDALFIKK